jgi:uncharacterized protein (TIGR02246 family)
MMSPPSAGSAADSDAIRALNQRLAAVSSAGDLPRWLDLFTDEMVLLPPLPAGQPALVGKEALAAWAQTAFRSFVIDETIMTDEVQLFGDLGFTRGTYRSTATPKAGGESHHVSGRFLFVVRRLPDGSWRYLRGIWNSDIPDSRPATEG